MRTALFLVVLVGLLFAFVYPTRTFLDQRESTNKARAQLELLQTENARMDREAKKLSTDSEIEFGSGLVFSNSPSRGRITKKKAK